MRRRALCSALLGLVAAAIGMIAAPSAEAVRDQFNVRNFYVGHEASPRLDFVGNNLGDQPDLHTAGAHPYLNMGFRLSDNSGGANRLDHIASFVVHTAPGDIGYAAQVPQCDSFLLNINACPANTKVGLIGNRAELDDQNGNPGGSVPNFGSIYNIVPFGNEPARLGGYVPGAQQAAPTLISVRDDGDFGIDSITPHVPDDIAHGSQKLTVRFIDISIVNQVNGKPFWTNPTACIPATTSVEAYSATGLYSSPAPVTFTPTGCSSPSTRPPFNPTMDVALETNKIDTPSGYTIGTNLPVNQNPALQDQSNVEHAKVVMPQGVTLAPGAAEHLQSCSEAQFVQGTNSAAVHCPAGSKVGEAEVTTPALNAPLKGQVYFATPTPADPWRIFIIVRGSGIRVKLVGKTTLDPQTGQITTELDNLPQTPFSRFELRFNGGSRSVFENPATCGTQTINSDFTPWSAAPSFAAADEAHPQASFTTSADGSGGACESPQPFRPTVSISSTPSQAGAGTHSRIVIDRPTGHQLIKNLNMSLPNGLIGSLTAVPRCSIAQAEAGTCGADSKVGDVTVSLGGGSAPLKQPGAVYIADPIAPGDIASLSVVVSAKAGPIDLGEVVVQSRVLVRPQDQGIDVISEDLPAILEGVPLRVDRIAIDINRDGFMSNPTGCDARPLKASFNSDQGLSASAETSFQASGCESEAFAPDLRMSAEGDNSRFGHPALRAIVSQSRGQSSIKRAVVKLPDVLRPELPTIQKSLCTSVQLAGNACPPASIVGNATANTPLLPSPLSGPIYLVQDPNPVDPLPRIVVRLSGLVSVELSARSTIEGVRTVNTFENLPDVPISRFEFYVNGGQPGILKNFHDLCSTTSRADATFVGHNGASYTTKPALEVDGCKPGSAGGVTISKKSIKVKRGIAKVQLTCNSPDGCEGKLTLAQAGKKGKAKGGPSLGSAPFSIAPNRKATVEVKLTRKGLKAVSKKKKLAATATATMPGASSSQKLTLAATRSKATRRR